MKSLLSASCLIMLTLFCNGQTLPDVGSVMKYPHELVSDTSLMNYTVYKPNTAIACKYPIRQVSKTIQRTVFMSEDDSLKMSFAFFDVEKLPFFDIADSSLENSYKFFAWDSAYRVKNHLPGLTIIKSDPVRGIIYYQEKTAEKTNLYLVGTKNKIVSLILFSKKDLQPEKVMGDMGMSFSLNSKG